MIIFRPAKTNDLLYFKDILKKQNVYINDCNFIGNVFFVAEVDDKIVGIGCLEKVPNNIGIISVILKPAEYEILIGLVKSILNYADRRDIKKVYASSADDCIEFYKSLGFITTCNKLIEVKIKKSALAKTKNDTVMELNLTGYFDKQCLCKNT